MKHLNLELGIVVLATLPSLDSKSFLNKPLTKQEGGDRIGASKRQQPTTHNRVSLKIRRSLTIRKNETLGISEIKL